MLLLTGMETYNLGLFLRKYSPPSGTGPVYFAQTQAGFNLGPTTAPYPLSLDFSLVGTEANGNFASTVGSGEADSTASPYQIDSSGQWTLTHTSEPSSVALMLAGGGLLGLLLAARKP